MKYVLAFTAIAVLVFSISVWAIARDFHLSGYLAGVFIAYMQNATWGRAG